MKVVIGNGQPDESSNFRWQTWQRQAFPVASLSKVVIHLVKLRKAVTSFRRPDEGKIAVGQLNEGSYFRWRPGRVFTALRVT